MPDTETVPTTVPELAAAVAADIRRFGHFRPREHPHVGGISYPDAPCCVLYGPTISPMLMSEGGNIELFTAFRGAVVRTAQLRPDQQITRWSDETPTEQVLAVLDQIAQEGTE